MNQHNNMLHSKEQEMRIGVQLPAGGQFIWLESLAGPRTRTKLFSQNHRCGKSLRTASPAYQQLCTIGLRSYMSEPRIPGSQKDAFEMVANFDSAQFAAVQSPLRNLGSNRY